MEDLAPKLYEQLSEYFDEKVLSDETLNKIYALIKDNKGNYSLANDFALKLGDILSETFQVNLSSSVLPDGKMYYNIANRTIEPLMKQNYELTSSVCVDVQATLNANAGIGIKAIKPELNEDRILQIIEKLSNEPEFDDIKWILDEPIVNFTQSIVDDSVKANAKFQYDSGLSPKVKRTVVGNCCKWCKSLAGTYDYDEVSETGNDVWRRHRFCRCTVTYVSESGTLKKVHNGVTKKERIILEEKEKEN